MRAADMSFAGELRRRTNLAQAKDRSANDGAGGGEAGIDVSLCSSRLR